MDTNYQLNINIFETSDNDALILGNYCKLLVIR